MTTLYSGSYAQHTFRATTESVIGFLEYVPPDYHNNSDKYPVVVFLHGIGERGASTTDPAALRESVQRVTAWGPPAWVNKGEQFPFILISPQLKNTYGSWPTWYVLEVIEYVKTYLRIDEKRIYLTGLSLGGGGAWWTAQDHPELFAALAPVCGGMNTPSKACRIAAENLPVWAFHGDKDAVVSVSKSITMVDAINACLPAPQPEAKMTVYRGVAHDAWKYAYQPNHSLHEPNVYEWMLSFKNVVNGENQLPTADAGRDQNIAGTLADIRGTGRDADGTIAGYHWRQLSGPSSARMRNPDDARLTVSGLTPGRYVFSLQVTDNHGGTDTDYVELSVQAPAPKPPHVDAGEAQLILLPVDTVSLWGVAHDEDGVIASWRWKQTSGPSASLNGSASPSAHVSGLTSGVFVFQLTVTDESGLSASDEVTVRVTAPPEVEAGPDVSVTSSVPEVVLKGTASDADGSIEQYSWTKVSGPDAALRETDSPALMVLGLVEGTYVFALTVRDDFNAVATDRVTVTVHPEMAPEQESKSGNPAISCLEQTGFKTRAVPVKDHSTAASGNDARVGLGDHTASELEGCQVMVFTEQGKRLFSGKWSPDRYSRIFLRSGLYIYHIIRNNTRIETGKVYIRR